jgi:hypothetical protein
MKTTNAGKTWSYDKRPDGQENKMSNNKLFFLDNTYGWATIKDDLYKTSNGGRSWAKILSNDAYDPYRKVYFINSDTGWGFQYDGELYKTEDGGESWKIIERYNKNKDMNDITFTDKKNGWIVGENGFVLFKEDGGDTWKEINSYYNDKSFWTIQFTKEGTGWIVGDMGSILTGKIKSPLDLEDEITNIEEIIVSPNPTSDYIEIIIGAQCAVHHEVAIYDVLGVEYTTPALRATPPYQGGEKIRIDVSSLSPGVYFVRAGDVVRKFVKM